METSVNQRIKFLRDTLKMSQGELGTKIGVTQTSIQRLESAQINLTNKMVKKFCDTLNINEKWLLEGKGEAFKAEAPKEEAKSNELYTVYEKVKYFLIGKGFWEGDTKTVISELFGAKRRVSKHA